MKKVNNLSWPERLALVNKFEPTDTQAITIFGISAAELATLKDMEKSGTIVASVDMDTEQYAPLFGASVSNPSTKSPGLTSVMASSGKGQPPLTATKRTAVPKKRGRKGTSITKAFESIPGTATAVDTFAKTHGVSVAVLRQSKRFDKTGQGQVRVKKIKNESTGTPTLMIWRESPTSQE